jgi:uncharacterized protein YyaL (SSP411 family)
MAPTVQRYGSGFGRLLCALDFYLGTPKEVAIIGETNAPETQLLINEIWKRYLPNKVVAQASPDAIAAAETIPLLRDRSQVDDKATAYVCEHFNCKKPTISARELASQLLESTAN